MCGSEAPSGVLPDPLPASAAPPLPGTGDGSPAPPQDLCRGRPFELCEAPSVSAQICRGEWLGGCERAAAGCDFPGALAIISPLHSPERGLLTASPARCCTHAALKSSPRGGGHSWRELAPRNRPLRTLHSPIQARERPLVGPGSILLGKVIH